MQKMALIAILLSGSLVASELVKEPELSTQSRKDIEKTLLEFRSNGTITPKQYDQSIEFLRVDHCGDVDRSLSPQEKAAFSAAISSKKDYERAVVQESFKYLSWQILLVDFPYSEPGFLFYSASPQLSESVSVWGGANGVSEGPDLVKWLLANVPGVPKPLANCFSWHVTFGHW